MNTNPSVKRILCFGDSNTWGRVPGNDNNLRYAADKRWTGILQALLGDEFEILEEGHNGRTANLDSPFKEGKNGAKYLFSCLESQKPIDLVILQLGKNELKARYNVSSEVVGSHIKECIEVINKEGRDTQGTVPKVILITTAIIQEVERLRFGKLVTDFLGANKKSRELVGVYTNIAQELNIDILDISVDVLVSDLDGVHLGIEAHKILAQIIHQKVLVTL